MKALFYTIILSAILFVGVYFMRSTQRDAPTILDETELPTPMAVQSESAHMSHMDPAELERVNQHVLFETGRELLDLWHLPEAVDVFEALVVKDPSHRDAYLHLVECYSHPIVASEKRAIECWNKARTLAAESPEDTTWAAAFRSLFIDYTPSAAVGQLRRVVNRDGQNVAARVLLARALLAEGSLDEAERYLVDLLEGDQSLGRARELLIQSRLMRGKYDEAEKLARDLATLYPEEPYPYVLLSRVQLAQGNVEDALGFCRNALFLDKRYVPAIICRAHLYLEEGEQKAARVSFEKLLMFDDPTVAAIGHEGIAYVEFMHGAFDEGTEHMDEAIRQVMSVESKRRGMLYAFRLVDYMCELGRVDAAEAVLDRWVRRYSAIPVELAELRVRIARGHLEIARRNLARLGSDEKWQSWVRSLAMDRSDIEALALIQEKNFSRALEVLKSSTAKGRESRHAYLTGYALFKNGDAEGAADFFETSRRRAYTLSFPYHADPVLSVQSVFFLAEASLARGESEEASRYYQDFLDLWGDTDWDLEAVKRARATLETLSVKPSNP